MCNINKWLHQTLFTIKTLYMTLTNDNPLCSRASWPGWTGCINEREQHWKLQTKPSAQNSGKVPSLYIEGLHCIAVTIMLNSEHVWTTMYDRRVRMIACVYAMNEGQMFYSPIYRRYTNIRSSHETWWDKKFGEKHKLLVYYK